MQKIDEEESIKAESEKEDNLSIKNIEINKNHDNIIY